MAQANGTVTLRARPGRLLPGAPAPRRSAREHVMRPEVRRERAAWMALTRLQAWLARVGDTCRAGDGRRAFDLVERHEALIARARALLVTDPFDEDCCVTLEALAVARALEEHHRDEWREP